jgi:hypothetical protein
MAVTVAIPARLSSRGQPFKKVLSEMTEITPRQLQSECYAQTQKIVNLCGRLNDIERIVVDHIKREECVRKQQTSALVVLVAILVLLFCLGLRVL